MKKRWQDIKKANKSKCCFYHGTNEHNWCSKYGFHCLWKFLLFTCLTCNLTCLKKNKVLIHLTEYRISLSSHNVFARFSHECIYISQQLQLNTTHYLKKSAASGALRVPIFYEELNKYHGDE